MIEKKVLNYLRKHLKVPVFMEQPEDKIYEYVLLEKTGSSQADFINFATIAIQSYGSTLLQAAVLNEEVKGVMFGMTALPDISKVQLNTDYNFTDTTKKKYRYQAVYDLVY